MSTDAPRGSPVSRDHEAAPTLVSTRGESGAGVCRLGRKDRNVPYLRDIIFQLTLQIYAHLQSFKDITSMYREVHAKCILEGLDLVGKCQVPSEKSLADMTAVEKGEYNRVVGSDVKIYPCTLLKRPRSLQTL